MGAVYLVEHVDLKTRHAIKVLLPHLSKHPQIVQRFRNEARAAAATRSPNIVAVRDVGQLDDGSWYLVMDYWDGLTLKAFLASRGPLPHNLIIRTAVDALNGLAAAHHRHIIHRDLKPDNLYLAEIDGDLRAMILDFGVCRLGDDAGVVTRTGAVLGTPKYMPPEQFRGQPIDHRADLWAIGAIVYEMATGGWLPYDGEGAPRGELLDEAALNARMSYPPMDPRRRGPGIPSALADAILTMIDPDPARRPANASASALLLAGTLPGDGYEPSGLEIVQKRAPELLKGLNIHNAVRSSPVMGAHENRQSQGRRPSDRTASPRGPAPIKAASPASTLGSAASQSSPRAWIQANRRRWRIGAFAVVVSLAVLAITVLAYRSASSARPGSANIAAVSDTDTRVTAETPPRLALAPAAAPDAKMSDPLSIAADARAPEVAVVTTRPDASVPDSAMVEARPDARPPDAPPPDARPPDARPPDAGAVTPHRDESVAAISAPDAGIAVTHPGAGVISARPVMAHPPAETGVLTIYVAPFAQVWVDDASTSVGQTPLHLKLRVGSHRIRLENKRLNKQRTVSVTVTTAREAVIDETW